MKNLIIGIDEAGRGPLAGPVSVGSFVAPKNFKDKLIKIVGGRIKDSKQLTHKKREEIYKIFLELKQAKQIWFKISHISNKIIDKLGISKAVQKGINKNLSDCSKFRGRGKVVNEEEKEIEIRLDGLLKVPTPTLLKLRGASQKTIIGGDAKDIFIACASIVAKVERDRLMIKLSKKYPKYGFDRHKGYGTKLHYQNIKKYGLSEIHRKTYCKNLIK